MGRSKLVIILLLALSLALPGLAQLPVLSFSAFINGVKKQHPVALKAGNIAAQGKFQLRSAQGNFDPQLNGTLDNKFFSGTNYYNTAIAEVKQGLYSGQTIKAGVEYGAGVFVNPEEDTKNNILPYIGLELSVLQGLVMDRRRYEVMKGAQYKKLLETESGMVMNELLHDASESYIEWMRDLALTEVNRRYMETATQRFKALQSLSDIGERPTIDTVEAAILIQTRQIDYGYARVLLAKAQNRLSFYLLKADSSLKWEQYTPLESINDMEERCLGNFLRSQNTDVSQNPGLVYYSNKSKLLEVEKKFRAELVKPKLDLRYNLLGNTSSGNTLYRNNYKWGAGFSMPLFLRNPVNDLKIARLELRNNEFEKQNKSADLNTKAQATREIMNVLAEQIQTAKQTLKYSRLLLEAEKIKFDNNESSLFLLNTRESKVLDSEIKLIELQSKFIDYYILLIYIKGDLNYFF